MPISVLIRLFTIPLGIMSALALARDGLGLKLMPFLDAIITAYGILFDDLFTDIVLSLFAPLFALLREWFDWNLNLYPHWKHAFVLMWLILTATRRVITSERRWGDTALFERAFYFVWGGVCALVASVVAGTVPLSDPQVFRSCAIGLMLYFTGCLAWYATFDRREDQTWVHAFGFWGFSIFAGTTFLSLFAAGIVPGAGGSHLPFKTSPSASLSALATLISIIGVVFLLVGALFRDGVGDSFLQKWLSSAFASVGLDILAVLGSAAAIVYVGHLLA